MQKTKNRVLSFFLVLVTVLAAFPFWAAPAMAAEEVAEPESESWTYEELYVQDGLTMLLSAFDTTDANTNLDLAGGKWYNWVDDGATYAIFKNGTDISWVKRSGNKGVGYDLTVAQMKSTAGTNTYLDMQISNLPTTDSFTVEQVSATLYISENGVRGTLNGYNSGAGGMTEKLGAWSLWAFNNNGSNQQMDYRQEYHDGTAWTGGRKWVGTVSNVDSGVYTIASVIRDTNEAVTTLIPCEGEDIDCTWVVYSYNGTEKQVARWHQLAKTTRYNQVVAGDSTVSYVEAADGLYVKTADDTFTLISTLERYKSASHAHWHSVYQRYSNGVRKLTTNTATAGTGYDKSVVPLEDRLIEDPTSFYLMRGCATTLYGVRVYNRALSEDEMKVNFLIDLCAFYGIDMTNFAYTSMANRVSLGNQFASYNYTYAADSDKVAALQNAITAAANAAASYRKLEGTYSDLYVKDGLTALFTNYNNNGSADIANGKWYSQVGEVTATIEGGVYNASTNVNGWRVYSEGGKQTGIYYRFLTNASYMSGQKYTKYGISLPANTIDDDDFTVEAVFLPLYISDENNNLVPHTNSDSGSQWGTYSGARSSFSIGGFQLCQFFASSYNGTNGYSGSSMNSRVFYYKGAWDDGANGKIANIGLKPFGTYVPQTQEDNVIREVFTFRIGRSTVAAAAYTVSSMDITFQSSALTTNYTLTNGNGEKETDGTGNLQNSFYDLSEQLRPVDLFRGFPTVVYAIRTYNRLLTEAEENQNHFADLCNYFEPDLTDFYALGTLGKQAVYDACADLTFKTEKADFQKAISDGVKLGVLADPEALITVGRELAKYYSSELNMKGVNELPLSMQFDIYYAIVNLCFDKDAEQSSLWALQQGEIDRIVNLGKNYNQDYANSYVQNGLLFAADTFTPGTVDLATSMKWYSAVGYSYATFAGKVYDATNAPMGWRLRDGMGVGYDITALNHALGEAGNQYLDLRLANFPGTNAYTVEKVAKLLVASENGVRATFSSKVTNPANGVAYDTHNTNIATEKLGMWGSWIATASTGASSMRTMYHNYNTWNHGGTWTAALNDGTWSGSDAIASNSNVIVDEPSYGELGRSLRTLYANGKKTGSVDSSTTKNGASALLAAPYIGAAPNYFYLMRNTANTMYAVRIYNRDLSAAEVHQNYFVDVCAYLGVDLSHYATLSDTAKQVVAAAFTTVSYTDTKEDLEKDIALLSGAYTTKYDELLVQDGLVGLFTAYGESRETVDLENSLWYNKVASVGGAATLKGGTTWWELGQNGGIKMDMTKSEWDGKYKEAAANFGTDLLSDSAFTVEAVIRVNGPTNNDGTGYYIDSAGAYGMYKSDLSAFDVGGMRTMQFGGSSKSCNFATRWFYNAQPWGNHQQWEWVIKDSYVVQTLDHAIMTMSMVYKDLGSQHVTYDYYVNMAKEFAFDNTTTGTLAKNTYIAPSSIGLNLLAGFPGELYAVRVYNKTLTTAQMKQNHFADIAAYYGLDIDYFLGFENKTAVYEAFASFDFSKTKGEAQYLLDDVTSAYAALARRVLAYEGLQARLGGTNSGIRSLWTINAITLAQLEEAGYKVAIGAIMGIGENAGVEVNKTTDLAVTGSLAEGYTSATNNSTAKVWYVTGGAEYTSGKYLDDAGTQFAYTMILDNAAMENKTYYNIGLVFRGFVVAEKDGEEQIVYMDASGATFGKEDAMYGDSTTIYEVADYFVNEYNADPAKAASYALNARLNSILSAMGKTRVEDSITVNSTFAESANAENGKIFSQTVNTAISAGTNLHYGFKATVAGEYVIQVKLSGNGRVGYMLDRSKVVYVNPTSGVLTLRVTLPVGTHAISLVGDGAVTVAAVNVYRFNTYTFYDHTGSSTPILKQVTAQAGSVITAPAAPANHRYLDYDLVFSYYEGFSNGMILDGDISFKAVYNATDRQAARRAEEILKACSGVICWGDSLTASAGAGNIDAATKYGVDLVALGSTATGATYPNVIQALMRDRFNASLSVTNGGVGGETSSTIASRAGAYIRFKNAQGQYEEYDYRMYLGADVTIPANTTTEVEIKIDYNSVSGRRGILRQGAGNSINPFTIVDNNGNRIQGTLRLAVDAGQSGPTCEEKYLHYWFKRSTAGSAVTVSKGNELIPYGDYAHDGKICVLYMGQNGGYSTIEDLYHQQLATLYACGAITLDANDRIVVDENGVPVGNYVIVGSHHNRSKTDNAYLVSALSGYWGDRFINTSAYFSSREALEDAGIDYNDISADDKATMATGACPSLYLADGVHFNAIGYALLGNLIYERMDAVGCFDEIYEILNTQYGSY